MLLMNTPLLPILWFLAILCLIPLVLWLLKRTPLGAANGAGVMRVVAQLSLAPNQRVVTLEVGQGEDMRWLVLGVSGQQINTLHVMPPQAQAPNPNAAPTFAHMLSARLRGQAGAPTAVGESTGDHRAG